MCREALEGFKGGLSAENYLTITETSRATLPETMRILWRWAGSAEPENANAPATRSVFFRPPANDRITPVRGEQKGERGGFMSSLNKRLPAHLTGATKDPALVTVSHTIIVEVE